ncbi:MAG: peptide-binding protein [Deltaproteobacteria bacterium]|nr:peptide-binding protein [Deltaproteobacteria bacterium]
MSSFIKLFPGPTYWKAALIALIVAVAFVLTGCNKSDTEAKKALQNSAGQRKADEPAYGDMIVRGSIGDASVLLPVLAMDSASFDITGLIYNGLVKYDKDIQIVPELCEKWDISEDNLRIRFHLRKDVKWQDGEPFTARDVEYTYKVYIDEKTPTAYATDFKRVENFHKLDDYTFEVTYKEPYAPALGSWTTGVLPAHLLEGTDITKSPLKRHPIGTGPYKFVEWKTGEKIIVDANKDYFAGRPYISRVLTRIIPDPATMFLELKAGRIDQMGLSPLQYSRQSTGKWWEENFHKYQYLSFSYAYLGYNLRDWKFEDKRVRQALTSAINRESIVEGVLLGLGVVAHTPYKPDTYWYNPNVKKWPYNKALAKELLAEAGWKDTDGDGILEKGGKPFEFTILTNQGNDVRKNAATIIQRDLKEVGVKVHIRVIEWAAILKNFIDKRRYEAIVLGWGIGQDPNQIDIWNSEKTKEHQLNFMSYDNKEVDWLLEQGVKTYDRAERKKFYDKFQEIIAEDQPYTFLWFGYSLPIISARFHGIKPAPIGIGYNFERWYVPKPLQKYHIEP